MEDLYKQSGKENEHHGVNGVCDGSAIERVCG